MNEGHSQETSPLDDFVRQFWLDCDADEMRGLDSYLAMFPGDPKAIAREYLELSDQVQADSSDSDRIGPYRVLRELGRGGQGVVYLAEDTRLPRRVAIKVLNELGPQSTAVLKRFRREAEVASRLDHPSICGIIETGTARGIPYIVMPFIEGKPLVSRFSSQVTKAISFDIDFEEDDEAEIGVNVDSGERAPQSGVDNLLRIFRLIAEALHAAHEAGVVHRDIKPGNILVRHDGIPVVLDLGLASIDSDDLPSLTMTGDVLGTPAYMSPEQVDGAAHELDRRTDVWSLGVTLYECLTGQRPFSGATRHALLEAIRWQEPVAPERINTETPRDLSRVIGVALAKQPEHRYATCADFAEDLRRVQACEPILAVPPGPAVRLLRWTQRRKALAVTMALALLSLVIGLVVSLIFLDQSRTNLAGFERLVDLRRLAEFDAAREELWPAHPENIADIEAWIVNAEKLRSRLHFHEDELRRLRMRPRSTREEALEDRKSYESRLVELASELSGLKVFLRAPEELRAGDEDAEMRRADAKQRIQVLEGRMEVMRTEGPERIHWILEDEFDQWRHDQTTRFLRDARTFFGLDGGIDRVEEMRERLHAAQALQNHMIGISDRWQRARESIEVSSQYHGLKIVPQMGLDPLGENEDTGLWEFAVVGSGEIPVPSENGRWVFEDQTAIVLVLLPGGTFTMGRADPDRAIDGPQHSVTLRPFFLGKYEVTQAQWSRIMSENLSSFQGSSWGQDFEKHPVEQVSWEDSMSGLRRVGLTLPTEAQWEYGARAGASGDYPQPDDVMSLQGFANIADEGSREDLPSGFAFEPGIFDGHAYPAAVGSYRPNPWGLYDSAGNVAEWCLDTQEFYDLPVDETGLRHRVFNQRRIFRGGSYAEIGLRAAFGFRNATVPSVRVATLGLRAARILNTEE